MKKEEECLLECLIVYNPLGLRCVDSKEGCDVRKLMACGRVAHLLLTQFNVIVSSQLLTGVSIGRGCLLVRTCTLCR